MSTVLEPGLSRLLSITASAPVGVAGVAKEERSATLSSSAAGEQLKPGQRPQLSKGFSTVIVSMIL